MRSISSSADLLRRRFPWQRSLLYATLIIAAAAALFPLYWAMITSIKVELQTFQPSFIPFLQFRPTLRHWVTELSEARPEYVKALSNSFIVAAGSTCIVLFIGVLAGYSLSRFRIRLGPIQNKDITTFVFSQIILPPAVIIIPFFLIIRTLRLTDSQLGLIIAHVTFNLPLGVLLSRDIILGLPREIEESALVDGCSRLKAIFRVVVPVILPAVITAGLICFAFSWNEFIFALTLTYERASTIPLLVAGAKWGRGIMFWFVAVRALVTLIPPIILSLIAQRYIVRGLTLGAVR